MLVTALNPHIGYDKAALIAKVCKLCKLADTEYHFYVLIRYDDCSANFSALPPTFLIFIKTFPTNCGILDCAQERNDFEGRGDQIGRSDCRAVRPVGPP